MRETNKRVPVLIGVAWALAVGSLLALWKLETDGALAPVYLRLSLVIGVAFPVLAGAFAFVFRWLMPPEKPPSNRADGPK